MTMGESRLSALAILSIESDLVETLSFDDIISEFSSMKARRIEFWTFNKITNTALILLCGFLISFYDGVKGVRHFVQKSKGGILRCCATGNASWIPVHCDAIIKWERSWKVCNPGNLKALWRHRQSNHMPALIAGDCNFTSKRNQGSMNIRFGNHCDLDEISQVSSSRGHSTFSLIVINCIHCNLTFRNCYLTCAPQFGLDKALRPGADVPPCPLLITPLTLNKGENLRLAFLISLHFVLNLSVGKIFALPSLIPYI